MEGDISIKKEDLTDVTYYDKTNYYEFKIVRVIFNLYVICLLFIFIKFITP